MQEIEFEDDAPFLSSRTLTPNSRHTAHICSSRKPGLLPRACTAPPILRRIRFAWRCFGVSVYYPANFPKMTAGSTRDPMSVIAASRPYGPYFPEPTRSWDAPPSRGGFSHRIPTFEDIFQSYHNLLFKKVWVFMFPHLRKRIRDLVDEARYLSNTNNVLIVTRDSMRARVVSTTSSHRRWSVPNYTKVEDNDSECQKNGRHFHERGGQFSPCIATSPKQIPIHKTYPGLLVKLVIPFHHTWKMQLCQQPGAPNSYNPTNTGAWNSCLRRADSTETPLKASSPTNEKIVSCAS